jgi:predicted transcriptional regulator
MSKSTRDILSDQTSSIAAAYVVRNAVPAAKLPDLIASIHMALFNLMSALPAPPKLTLPTRNEIAASIGPAGLVSFIDGKTYKTLKRHLTANGLSPQSYRERYGLPADYPMVARSYAERRSALAKAIGLGVPGAMAERNPKNRKAARS